MIFEGVRDGKRAYLARGAGYRIQLTPSEAVLSLKTGGARASRLRLGLIDGAPDPVIDPVDRQPGTINYLIGNDPSAWRTGVPAYGGLIYRQVYPGIDLHFYGNQRRLEYDFIVAPGADPERIRLAMRGAARVRLDDGGDLLIDLAGGTLRQHRPVVYQLARGEKLPVEGRYIIGTNDEISFEIGDYDRGRELIIDPVLSYASYLGGGNDDQAAGIAIGRDGDIYLTGFTAATEGSADGFPSVNGLQPSHAGFNDVFVTRFRPAPDGTATVVYSSFLGGSDDDRAGSMALDGDGSIYLAGQTNSTNFPVAGGMQKSFASSAVFKLTGGAWVPRGSGLSANDVRALAVRADEQNAIYAATLNNGVYRSADGGASWRAVNGAVNQSEPEKNALLGSNEVRTLAVAGTVLLAGTSRGIFRTSDGGATWLKPVFEIAQDPAGQERITAAEDVLSLAVDPDNPLNVFIGTSRGVFRSVDGGASSSPAGAGLPNLDPGTGLSSTVVRSVTILPAGGKQVVAGTSDGIFISDKTTPGWTAKNSGLTDTDVRSVIAASSGTLIAATAGGIFRSEDTGATWAKVADGDFRSLTADSGAIYAASAGSVIGSDDDGRTWAAVDTGLTAVSINSLAGGAGGSIYLGARAETDGFLVRLSNDGRTLIYSTYLGGGGSDQANGVAVSSTGKAFMTGTTASANFPLKGSTDRVEGGNDAFIVEIDTTVVDAASLVLARLLGGAGSDQGNGIAIDAAGSIYVTGGSGSATFRGANNINGYRFTNGNTAVFRSGDSAATWSRFGDGLSGDQADAIVVDPKTPTTLYAGNANGLFKRTKDDAAWVRKTGAPDNVRAIAIDPVDPQVIYLGSERGIFRSTDAGETWVAASTGMLSRSVRTLALDAANPKTIFAGMSFGGIYRSTDGGSTWRLSNGPAGTVCMGCLPGTTASTGRSTANVRSLAVLPGSGMNPPVVFAGLNGGVYRSGDGGATWSALNGKVSGDMPCQSCLPGTNPPDGSSLSPVDVVAVDPKNGSTIYAAVSGAGLFKSADGGMTWNPANAGLPGTDAATGRTTISIRALAIDATTPAVLYIGAAGGLFRSADGGATWRESGNSLTSSVISVLALDPADGRVLYAGSGSEAGDAFAARIKPDGTALEYFTFLGGGDGDAGNAIAVRDSGTLFVAGRTSSRDFPVTADALQKSQAGGGDAFLTRLDSGKNGDESLTYSTFFGGAGGNDSAASLALDAQGNIILAGATASADLPLRNPVNQVLNGSSDGFVSVLDPSGAGLVYSTYLGGGGRDAVTAVAVDTEGSVLAAGVTFSADFPVSPTAYDGTIGMRPFRRNPLDPAFEMRPGGSDAFIARISGSADAADLAITMTASGTFRVGEVVSYDLTVTVEGSAAAAPLRIVDQLPDSLSYVSSSGIGWTCAPADSAVSCSRNSPLAAGSQSTLRLNLRIIRAPAGGRLTNVVSVFSRTGDPKPENNTARSSVDSIAPACPFGISPSMLSFDQAGGEAGITIETDGDCGWTVEATQNAGFITILEGSGRGPGTARISVARNPSSLSRTGTLNVAGRIVTVIQSGIACEPVFTPARQTIEAAGGTGSVDVELPADCAWSAVSDDPGFLTITSGADGAGNGKVEYRVARHEGIADRVGTLTIAGRQFRVTQNGIVCTIALSPTTQSFGFDGGAGSITVTAPNACAWTVTNANPNFIRIVPDGLSDGSGSGSVGFEVSKNPAAVSRIGKILIAELEFTIRQDALGCSFTLDPAQSRPYDARGGDGVVLVSAAQDTCAWHATGAGFVAMLSDAEQTGTAHALFRVEPNRTGSPRKTVITLAGRGFEIAQNAAPPEPEICTYSIDIPPAGQTIPAVGGMSTIRVTAPDGCAWRATVDDASMVQLSGAGTGSGSVDFSVSPNSGDGSRVGIVTIAGQTVIIRQEGALTGDPCRIVVAPGRTAFDAGGGDGTIIVNASQTTCEWTVTSSAGFLRIRNDTRAGSPDRLGSLSQSTTAYVVFDLMPNDGAADRTATLTVAGQSITIRQSGRQGALPLSGSRRSKRRP